MLQYGKQCIDDDDIAAVVAVLRGEALTCGPTLAAFEAALCQTTGAPHAVAVSNGTSALRLLYQAAGIGPGVRVGVPAITFVATASQALLLGAEVVLLDVDPQTLVLTPAILAACRERLDVVVAVHLAGRMCDLQGLAAICRERGARLLEDAAHALGSRDGQQRCGDCRWSDGAILSFHPVKNITTGEGGAILVKDDSWDRRLRSLRHHGIVRDGFTGAQAEPGAPWYHEFHEPATNERLTDLQAALGLSQLKKLDRFRQARAAMVDFYRELEQELPWFHGPAPAPGQEPFWHLAIGRFDWRRLGLDRRAVHARLAAVGVQAQLHYIPLHHQPACSRLPRGSDLSGAEAGSAAALSLPCHPGLDAADRARIAAALRSLGWNTQDAREERPAGS